MTGFQQSLFSMWQLVEHQDGLKPLTSVIFGALTLYAIQACLRLPPQTPRKAGEASTPGVRWSRLRWRLWLVAGLILMFDALTLAAYIPIWFTMQKVEKPTSFPDGHYLYLLWGACLSGVAIQVILGVLFLTVETRLKASK